MNDTPLVVILETCVAEAVLSREARTLNHRLFITTSLVPTIASVVGVRVVFGVLVVTLLIPLCSVVISKVRSAL